MSSDTNSSIIRSNRILQMQTPPQITPISSSSSSSQRKRKPQPHFHSPPWKKIPSSSSSSSSSADSSKKSIPVTSTKSSNSTTTTTTMKADAADGLLALRPPRRSPRFYLSNLNPFNTSGKSPSIAMNDVRAAAVEGLLALGPRRSPRFAPSNTTPTPNNDGRTTPLTTTTSSSSSKRKRRPATRYTPPSPMQKKQKTSKRCGVVQEDNSAHQLCKESFGLELPLNKTSLKSRKNTHFSSILTSIQNVSTEKTDIKGYPQTPKVCSSKSMAKIHDEVKERFELDGVVNKESTPQHFTSIALTNSFDGEILPQKGNVQGPTSSKDYKEKIKVDKDVKSLIFPAAMMPEGGGVQRRSRNINTQTKEIGDKRAGSPSGNKWTKDQELALQKAYFNAKPSPHFWKKVSKMVPGKSAQECFDKIHSEATTPPQPQPRCRAKRTNLSPLGQISLSASKLLEPANQNTERPKAQNKCHAHKTVRHLLQKHNQVDRGYEADVFPLYEHAMNSSSQSPLKANLLLTPPCSLKSNDTIQEYQERSSSSNKKRPLSRFGESHLTTALESPPVLKQIKNKALHEKYIDQLHCREARRMAGQKRSITAKEGGNLQNVNVAAARNALVANGRDAIKQFQNLQAHANDDDYDVSREEEDEDDELGL